MGNGGRGVRGGFSDDGDGEELSAEEFDVFEERGDEEYGRGRGVVGYLDRGVKESEFGVRVAVEGGDRDEVRGGGDFGIDGEG
ncbi:MAG: hypothetical protein ABIM44_05705 [candidate division WOR-3 bacterium]